MSDANDPMAEIRASFFIECEELMEALQDGLTTLDEGDDDPETINVVFRAVHSIKGGAGAFGLEAMVRFAHRYETALDDVRSNKFTPDADAMRLFFACADHLSDLIRVCRDDEPMPDERSAELLAQLDDLLGGPEEEEEEVSADDFEPMGVSMSLDLDGLPPLPDLPDLDASDAPAAAGNDGAKIHYIRFKPQQDMFETGNEPQMLLRNLGALGKARVECDMSELPALDTLAAETPYLAWNITLEADVDEAEIREIFEFVEGLCELSVSTTPFGEDEPEPAPAPQQSAAIEALPEPPATVPDDAPEEAPAEAAPAKLEIAKAPKEAAQPPAPSAAAEESAGRKPAGKPAGAAANTPKSVVRVDLERIERLVNLVGELVINQAMLSQSLEQAGLSPHSDAMNGLEEFQRLTRDIQDSVMMIRAQPVKSLFQRMSRIIREASAAVGKNVRLVTDGEGTEVDKTVIERLADPLTHMIRNAVDHGLESKDDRIAAGKSPEGIVTLSAAHRSGRVVIEISDDGAGINRKRVLEIAIKKGLVPADANLSDSDIDNLLFAPGFSTASQISDLSGRGVGMDVVKTAIQALGGRITITSEAGKGTKFSISLPLTLAVLDGMVVNVADETLVVPLNVVVETLSLGEADVEMLRPGKHIVRVRGEFVPLFDLGVELGYRPPRDSYVGAIVLLIAYEDGARAALIIDGIQDQRQVVIKGLDDSFFRAPGIAAATILGDGQIALILDPADIIAEASGASRTEALSA